MYDHNVRRDNNHGDASDYVCKYQYQLRQPASTNKGRIRNSMLGNKEHKQVNTHIAQLVLIQLPQLLLLPEHLQ